VRFGDPKAPAPFDVSCAAAGAGRWIDDKTFSYDFERDLPDVDHLALRREARHCGRAGRGGGKRQKNRSDAACHLNSLLFVVLCGEYRNAMHAQRTPRLRCALQKRLRLFHALLQAFLARKARRCCVYGF
jgi:hypothetical protein